MGVLALFLVVWLAAGWSRAHLMDNLVGAAGLPTCPAQLHAAHRRHLLTTAPMPPSVRGRWISSSFREHKSGVHVLETRDSPLVSQNIVPSRNTARNCEELENEVQVVQGKGDKDDKCWRKNPAERENTAIWEDDNENEAENENVDTEDMKSVPPKKENAGEEEKNVLRKMLQRGKKN